MQPGRQPVLTLFYQFNPWSSSIGGIQTIIKTFIKYSPDDFDIRLVGIGNREQVPGVWQSAQLYGTSLKFMPLFILEEDDVRRRIPTSVKYTLALLKRNLASDYMHFHRLEPSLAALNWKGHKTLFIHNDLRQQISSSGKKTILWQRFPAIYYALERSLLSQFDQILSCNSESTQFYQQTYPSLADRVNYLKNTVDNKVFFPLPESERQMRRQQMARQLNLPEETQFILFAGRLHPQKDPLLLVRSMARLQVANAHLLIAGQGELTEPIRAEINRLNLGSTVTLLGAVPQNELSELQRVSSLLVLTSLYEGLPVVVLEALACGTPIVTTNCGETPRLLISGSGLVCQERTEDAIAESMRQVLLQPEQFPSSACEQAAHPYSAETVVQTIFDQMRQHWQDQVGNPALA